MSYKGSGQDQGVWIVKRLISLLFILADRNAMVTLSRDENLSMIPSGVSETYTMAIVLMVVGI